MKRSQQRGKQTRRLRRQSAASAQIVTFYRAALDDQRDAICRWTPDGTITFANQAYAALYDKTLDAVVGQQIAALVPDHRRAETAVWVAAVLATLEPAQPVQNYELRTVTRAGVRWQQWTNTGYFDAAGRLQDVQSVAHDITQLMQSVEEARESEARYRLLAEYSRDVISRISPDGLCRYVSPACTTQLGYEPAELVGTSTLDFCHPDDVAAVVAAIDLLRGGADGVTATYRSRRKDRTWLWTEANIRAVRDAGSGRIEEFILVGRDVSARKAAEDALRDSQQRLDLALRATNLGLWDWDVQQGSVVRDARWASILGYSEAEANALQMPWQNLVHPDDLSALNTSLVEHLKGQTAFFVHEHRVRARSGEWTWALACGQVVARAPDGRALRVIGTQRDITEQKRAEAAVRESEERLRSLVESVPDYVATTALDGTVLFINRLAPGVAPSQVIGRTIFEHLHREDQAGVRAAFEHAVARGQAEAIGLCRPARTDGDGDGRWYEVRFGPIRSDDAVVGMTVVSTDVTAQKQREQTLQRFNAELEARVSARTAELQASLRELEAFSYSVSHDLRGPLRAIDGFSQALLEDCAAALDAAGRDYLGRVRRAAQRMGQLIDDLLKLARVMRSELRHEPVALSALVREVADELTHGTPEPAVEVVIAPGLYALGDAPLLRVALVNLLDNAWKFSHTRPRPRIEFGVEERAGEPAYFVRDNGVGFDMAHTARLFHPFERLHEPDAFPGTGIGLATVHRIIARHGGRIWADAGVDSGATFYFTLSAPPDRPR